MDGLLVIDKPIGPTSHDVVVRMRRILGERRLGHTGTLDPGASGVLPLVLGRATRLARFLSASDKRYEAVIRVGVATDSYDAHGAPLGPTWGGALPSREMIDAALDAFRGSFLQQPPAYSAKKVAGRRSYKTTRAARSDRPDPPDPSTLPAAASVTVRRLEVLQLEGDLLTVRVDCSAGFYVRSLAHDLGQRLGTGAHLAALRRISSGDFTIADALPLRSAEEDPNRARRAVVPLVRMLPRWSAVVLTDEGARRVAHGRDIGPDDITRADLGLADPMTHRPPGSADNVRLLDPQGELIGIAVPAQAPGLLHPSVILV